MPGQCQNVKGRGASFESEALMNAGGNYNRPKVAKFLVG